MANPPPIAVAHGDCIGPEIDFIKFESLSYLDGNSGFWLSQGR